MNFPEIKQNKFSQQLNILKLDKIIEINEAK